MLLGSVYLAQGEAQAAEVAFLRAIELSPRLLDPYVRLGVLYAGDRAPPRSVGQASRRRADEPAESCPAHDGRGHPRAAGDIAKARSAYEKALSLNPQFAPAANNLAWLDVEHGGDQDRALRLVEVAKSAAPDDPRVSDTLGWVLHRRGMHERALDLLKDSASKLPGNPQVQYHLGMVYAKLGDKDKAQQALTLTVSPPARTRHKKPWRS